MTQCQDTCCAVLCCAMCAFAYPLCNRPMKVAELQWDHKLFTHKLSLCVCECECERALVHAQQCVATTKKLIFYAKQNHIFH